jgi:hypothetical protein
MTPPSYQSCGRGHTVSPACVEGPCVRVDRPRRAGGSPAPGRAPDGEPSAAPRPMRRPRRRGPPHQMTDEQVVHVAEGDGGMHAEAAHQPIPARTPPQGGKGIQTREAIEIPGLRRTFTRLGDDGADEGSVRQRLPHPGLRVGIAHDDRALPVNHHEDPAVGRLRRGRQLPKAVQRLHAKGGLPSKLPPVGIIY